MHRLAIGAHHHVAGLQARLLGRAAGLDRLDLGAALVGLDGADPHAQEAALGDEVAVARLQRHLHHDRLAVAPHLHAERLAGRQRAHDPLEAARAAHRAPVGLHDQVPDLQPRAGGARAGAQPGHAGAGAAGVVLEREAGEHAVRDQPLLAEVRQERLDLVDRDRVRHAGVVAGAEPHRDPPVDPEQPPLEVEQRAARVARVDRGVALERVAVAALEAVHRADHPHRHVRRAVLREAERVAERDHGLPGPRGVRVAELDVGERPRPLELEQRDVPARVGPDHDRALEHAAGAGHDPALAHGAAAGHVVVGEHVAVGRDDHARAAADRHERAADPLDRVFQATLLGARRLEQLGGHAAGRRRALGAGRRGGGEQERERERGDRGLHVSSPRARCPAWRAGRAPPRRGGP